MAAAETVAAEMRDLVRQAAGDVAGKTISAQIRQAARNLGYEPESWRVREAWHGRAGRWHPAAIEDMRRRFAAWREREAVGAMTPGSSDRIAVLAKRVDEIRRGLAEVMRQIEEVDLEILRTSLLD